MSSHSDASDSDLSSDSDFSSASETSYSGDKWSEIITVTCRLPLKVGERVPERIFDESRKHWTVEVESLDLDDFSPNARLRGSLRHKSDCHIRIVDTYGFRHRGKGDTKCLVKLPELFDVPFDDANGHWNIDFEEELYAPLKHLAVTLIVYFRRNQECKCKDCHPPPALPSPLLALSSDFLNFSTSPEFSDFVLEVEGVSIPVNKAFLSARSPYFKRLFASGMIEAVSGRIEIKDVDLDSVKQVVKFLYCGQLPEDLDDAPDCYLRMADMYEIKDLKEAVAAAMIKMVREGIISPKKFLPLAVMYRMDDVEEMCIATLMKRLKKKNVIPTLILAHQHRYEPLKKMCFKEIKHWKKDMDDSAFEPLKAYPDLLFEFAKKT